MLHTLGHFSELEESKGVQRRKPLEAIPAAPSSVPAPYGPADGATGSYL